jgi:hypothetical protein
MMSRDGADSIRSKMEGATKLISERLPEGISVHTEINQEMPEMDYVFNDSNPINGEIGRIKVVFTPPEMTIGKVFAGAPNIIAERDGLKKISRMHEITRIAMKVFQEANHLRRIPDAVDYVSRQLEKEKQLEIISRSRDLTDALKAAALPQGVSISEITAKADTNSLIINFDHNTLNLLGFVRLDYLIDDEIDDEEIEMQDEGEEFDNDDEYEDDEETLIVAAGRTRFKVCDFYSNCADGHIKERQKLMSEIASILCSILEKKFGVEGAKRFRAEGFTAKSGIEDKNLSLREPSQENINLPPKQRQLLQALSTRAFIPGERIKRALPHEINAESKVYLAKLAVSQTFTHETLGSLGRIDAVYAGEGLSLSGLYCGIRDTDGTIEDENKKSEREKKMLEIYEIAKKAFADD